MSDEKAKATTGSNGKTLFDLGEGWVPLEFLVMVKCLDPKGNVKYRELSSPTLHPVEALGMLSTMEDTVRTKIMNGARPIGEWDE